MDGVTIREAVVGDAKALVELHRQLGSPRTVLPSVEETEEGIEALTEMPWLHVLVAEAEGRVVGTVTIALVPSVGHDRRPWAQVENMVVDEGHRRQGIGEALIRRCEEITREAGGYKVQLISSGFRKGAHAFYEAIGFSSDFAGFRLYLAL